MFIYKITNKINEKIYIGMDSSQVERRDRWKFHKKTVRRLKQLNSLPSSYLYRAMLKYGIENFEVEVIDCAITREELIEMEIFWIAHYDTYLGEGYNMTAGGDGATPGATPKWLNELTDEERKNRSDQRSKINFEWWSQKEITEDDREIYSSAQIKRIQNETADQLAKRVDVLYSCVVKSWKITNPDGKMIVVEDLVKFCRDNNLNYYELYNSKRYKRKSKSGWLVTLV